MIFTKPQLVLKAEAEALKQEIDPALVCAIIDVVSEWHPEKTLIEMSAHNPALVFPSHAEAQLSSCRIGLMQFHGSQARVLGYKQNIEGLMEPSLNVEIGVKLLKSALDATGKQFDRSLVVVYGHSIVSSIRNILSRIKPYQDFLSSPARPNLEQVKKDGVHEDSSTRVES